MRKRSTRTMLKWRTSNSKKSISSNRASPEGALFRELPEVMVALVKLQIRLNQERAFLPRKLHSRVLLYTTAAINTQQTNSVQISVVAKPLPFSSSPKSLCHSRTLRLRAITMAANLSMEGPRPKSTGRLNQRLSPADPGQGQLMTNSNSFRLNVLA